MSGRPVSYDLISQPWILVLDEDGAVAELSLLDAFTRARHLVEIVGEAPTQSFAILRLLLAILHRSLRDETARISGPATVREWTEAREQWLNVVVPAVTLYLEAHQERFDLFHPRTPFFQSIDLAGAKVSGLEKLIIDVPNGAPFFTTRARRGLEQITAAEAARWLVHVHAFDPSGIRTGIEGDPRAKRGKVYPTGPGWTGQIGGVHLAGKNLVDTLSFNLVVRSALKGADCVDDVPPWERSPTGAGIEDRPGPTGPVDLYTWQARRVMLVGDPGGVTGLVLGNGDPMTPQNRHILEPMSRWRFSEPQSKKFGETTYMPLQHAPEQSLWRGLTSLLPRAEQRRRTKTGEAQYLEPDLIRWAAAIAPVLLRQGGTPVDVRAVGLVYGSNNSVVDEMIDDRLELPAALLADTDGTLIQMTVDVADSTQAGVRALSDLSARLAQAAGARPDELEGPRARAAERVYADLDLPFRLWLSSLTVEEPPDEAQRRWRREGRLIVRDGGRDLVDAADPLAWVGRVVSQLGAKRVLLDAGLAWNWFETALSKVLPYDPRPSSLRPASRGGNPVMTSVDLLTLINVRVSDLQRRYLANRDPKAFAQLAQLRAGVGKLPGSIPAIWDLTVGGIPRAGRGDDPPSPTEVAAHTALTLYAVHQQSRANGMHERGASLGSAVRELVRRRSDNQLDGDREAAVRRRFDALTTSNSVIEATQHLRGLIAQLRSEEVPLDYGWLASDLERMHSRRGFDDVRRAWGRAYHARRTPAADDGTTDVATTAPATDAPSKEEEQ